MTDALLRDATDVGGCIGSPRERERWGDRKIRNSADLRGFVYRTLNKSAAM